ncbi:MAG TPA: hypothetical protein VF605_12955 [Allosphingosinicella sp.]
MDWNQIKETIAVWTDLERDALHIYAALIVQVGAALVLRRRLSHALPWAAVLAFAVGNEWLDTYGDDLVEQWELDASLHDLWNTMLLPTLLLLLVRFAPGLFAARAAKPVAGEPGEEAA